MPWRQPRNVEQRASRMRHMIDRLGVDKGTLARAGDGEVVALTAQRCLDCKTVDECMAWFAGDASGPKPEEFCPNHATFRNLK